MSGRATIEGIHSPGKTGAFPVPNGVRCANTGCNWRLDNWGYFWMGNGPYCHRCAASAAEKIDYTFQFNRKDDPYRLSGLAEGQHSIYLPARQREVERYTMQRLLGTRPKK